MNMFAQAVLCIPKILITNSGHDIQTIIGKAMAFDSGDFVLRVDLENAAVLAPGTVGIYDVDAAIKPLNDARYLS